MKYKSLTNLLYSWLPNIEIWRILLLIFSFLAIKTPQTCFIFKILFFCFAFLRQVLPTKKGGGGLLGGVIFTLMCIDWNCWVCRWLKLVLCLKCTAPNCLNSFYPDVLRERERERESLWQHFTSSEMKSEEKRREEKKKMKWFWGVSITRIQKIRE